MRRLLGWSRRELRADTARYGWRDKVLGLPGRWGRQHSLRVDVGVRRGRGVLREDFRILELALSREGLGARPEVRLLEV